MLKVKVISCRDEDDLTDEINEFIEEIYKQGLEVLDVKFSANMVYASHSKYFFSALITYTKF